MDYNFPFFGLFENVFKLLKSEYGEEKALELFAKLMATGLSKSYGIGFEKGLTSEFERLVGDRDKLVGLRVGFPKVIEDELVYQFYDDPFPNLKGFVNPQDLDRCYMSFKVRYILGENWDYKTMKHIWHGDNYTEHVLYRK